MNSIRMCVLAGSARSSVARYGTTSAPAMRRSVAVSRFLSSGTRSKRKQTHQQPSLSPISVGPTSGNSFVSTSHATLTNMSATATTTRSSSGPLRSCRGFLSSTSFPSTPSLQSPVSSPWMTPFCTKRGLATTSLDQTEGGTKPKVPTDRLVRIQNDGGHSLTPQEITFNFYTEILARGTEMDVFGHINNSVYMQWLEVARWESLRGNNISALYGEVRPVVRKVEIDFLCETRAGDVLRVVYWPRRCSTSSFVLGAAIIISKVGSKLYGPPETAAEKRYHESRVGKLACKATIIQTCVLPGVGKTTLPEKVQNLFPLEDPGDLPLDVLAEVSRVE
eukprot:TRINITY_DN5457_c0_g1_i1.p1 TRINITY_DN5457_c0_g1~~TRINITY_DN5457_c0_g1_i1.p1  ORF type:complete len:365 (+),score=40.83 TRINITY_DN5457_c0_g1_i1:93-1097(+)